MDGRLGERQGRRKSRTIDESGQATAPGGPRSGAPLQLTYPPDFFRPTGTAPAHAAEVEAGRPAIRTNRSLLISLSQQIDDLLPRLLGRPTASTHGGPSACLY